jgi:DMSO/TMAO reductase YedYZ heme-binding membrane subunit
VKKDTFWPLVYFALFAVLLGSRLLARRRGGRGATNVPSS